MTVFIIGIVTVSALVWVLAASLANESDAQKRLAVRDSHIVTEKKQRGDYLASQQAA